MALTHSQQEMADEFVGIINQINTGRNPEDIRRLVEVKVAQMTAQEPFYLRSILDDDNLTPFQKAGAFTSLRHAATGEERYQKSYHLWLKKNTQVH